MKIKNIAGTTEKECVCKGWLNHWKKFTVKGKAPSICGVLGCSNTDVVGAHVRRTDTYSLATYIYPLCKAHNQSEDELDVWEGYDLVSANKQETCEKSPLGSILGNLYSYPAGGCF
jgi:hypothetical protein